MRKSQHHGTLRGSHERIELKTKEKRRKKIEERRGTEKRIEIKRKKRTKQNRTEQKKNENREIEKISRVQIGGRQQEVWSIIALKIRKSQLSYKSQK